MIKTIYICDFCKQTVSKEKDLYKVKVPDLSNLYSFSTPDHSICINCYTKLGKEVQKMIKSGADD